MKERDSNFELLRVVSMFLIVLYHTILHGHAIEFCQEPVMKIILQFILYLCVVHVNSFVLVTGYFQCKSKFNKKKVFSILGAAIFYMAVIILILEYKHSLSLRPLEIIKELLLIDSDSYWFVKTYIFLYILSPYINKLIDNLNKKEFQSLLIILTIITAVLPYITTHVLFDNNGYTLYSFVYLYLLGAYFRLYPVKKEKLVKKYNGKLKFILIAIFLCSALLNYGIVKGTNMIATNTGRLVTISNNLNYTKFDYCNVFVLIQTIAYFLFFSTISLKNKLINNISKLTFGVYLIHDNLYVRQRLYHYLKIGNKAIYSYKQFIYIFLIAILIFVVCCLIEWFRQTISNKIKKINKKWSWAK